MSKKFAFELVSPEEKLVSTELYMAVIPGDEGEFGVMAGHCSLVSSLKPGVVKLFSEEGQPARRIFITGGFADVSAQNCTIIAEEAVNVKDLNQKTLEQDLANLNEDLGMAAEDSDKKRITGQINLTKARLKALVDAS